MLETLTVRAPDTTQTTREIQSTPRREATRRLVGAEAVGQLLAAGSRQAPESTVDVMEDRVDESSQLEGERNAALFKQTYDAAIASIDGVLAANGEVSDGALVTILDSIDALSDTPYIASVPEFMEFVRSARASIEQIRTHTASDNDVVEMNSTTIVHLLLQAKQQLDATTVAYQA